MSNSQNAENSSRQDASTSTTQPKQEKSSIVELKNGKAVLRQKLLPLEKLSETMQETVRFREYFDAKVKEGTSVLDKFPEEHLPLLAKMVQESEKTSYVLSKHIHEALKPLGEESSTSNGDTAVTFTTAIPYAVIEAAIGTIADRVNYGLDGPGKIPASLTLWRWEVKENYRGWLPASVQDKLQTRRLERQQGKENLRHIFEALPATEREALLKTNKKQKLDNSGVLTFSLKRTGSDENMPVNHAQGANPSGEGSSKSVIVTPKKEKTLDLEKLAKEKEKAEKKAAKVEKDRKEKEAQNKSRSLLSSFLKPKPTTIKAGILRQKASGSKTSITDSADSSDFDRTFKPFIVKKDASVAPVNFFLDRRKGKEVIVIDPDESLGSPVASSSKLKTTCSSVSLADVLAKARPKSRGRKRMTAHLKSSSRYCVRDLLVQLSEAEVLGDDATVRRILALLESRKAIPAKALIFDEDTRPGYFGTFTKTSSVVGPRTPFAKDAVAFDYGYDSGAEWEEEEAGDDLMSLDGSAEDGGSDADSEMDDWLVDDEVVVEPGTPIDERGGSPELVLLPGPSPSRGKRKTSEAPDKAKTKKRKVMPLVPFVKGPCYEERIGRCEYEPFKEYRIQLFNDTPFPIDPFTFVSVPFVETRQAPVKNGFVVPALPAHIQHEQKAHGATQASSSVPMQIDSPSSSHIPLSSSEATPPSLPSKRKVGASANLPPKTPFPDSLLPLLAEKIEELATGNLTWIVENLYRDLKAHKVKKNAIEAKVKEVGEKCPMKKVWKVREEVLRTIITPIA